MPAPITRTLSATISIVSMMRSTTPAAIPLLYAGGGNEPGDGDVEAHAPQDAARVAIVANPGRHDGRTARHFGDAVCARDVLPAERLASLLVTPGRRQHDETEENQSHDEL